MDSEYGFIAFVLFTLPVVLIAYTFFKRKVSYIFSDDIITHHQNLTLIAMVFNFFPALFLSVFTVNTLLRKIELINTLLENTNYIYLVFVMTFLISYAILIGMLIDYYFYNTHDDYREWKDKTHPKKKNKKK